MTISTLSHFGLEFAELYTSEGLAKLDTLFWAALQQDPAYAQLTDPGLLELAPFVENFVAKLFGVEAELTQLRQAYLSYVDIAKAKRHFVQRTAAKAMKPDEAALLSEPAIDSYLGAEWDEAAFANFVVRQEDIPEVFVTYAAWALYAPKGQAKHKSGTLFHIPHKLDFDHLIEPDHVVAKARDGFKLTDSGFTLHQAASEIHYCIWCHHQGKDSCSKGLKIKGTESFQTNPLGAVLSGCPLEQKISEMHEMASMGHLIGALAIIVIDNPMVAATGHRICNECMKACIYQKQDPVNIPAVETRILRDVLNLPWGVEIYSLLTRWNPLNKKTSFAKPATGHKVLVVGQGPAGFTLAHYLLNQGMAVTAIDGLKIEPLDPEISGVAVDGTRVPFKPIKKWLDLAESLDERVMAGFGGVAEYGITVRWDKNFLTLIRLMLERRATYQLLGGVRFGSSLTLDQAYDLGFDHIALAMGAGKPSFVPMKNNMAKGVRMASDFLMALQLTGAAKADSIANLQLRLPAVVIGGGLTAVDTATEALAYYPQQVEKFLTRFETLPEKPNFTCEEQEIADEFIAHAKALRLEKQKAEPDILGLLKSWGGVSLVYRRKITDAPSYRLNHEELHKALEEGIAICDEATPLEIQLDNYNHAKALVVNKNSTSLVLDAKAVLVAAGTSPNTILASEDNRVTKDGLYFQAVTTEGQKITPDKNCKTAEVAPFTYTHPDGRMMSFFGDLHPSFAGNVVKAMASAKRGFPLIVEHLLARAPAVDAEIFTKLNKGLRAFVHDVIRLTPTIIEVVVEAPFAAQAFEPGQFYRLQNFEALLSSGEKAMEALALTGAWVDKDKGLISTIVLEMGGSSNLCAKLKKGDPISLMGPTGVPTEVFAGDKVLLIGGGLGNAVLFSIGQALRKLGSQVLYVAGYKQAQDRYKVEEINAAADHVIWCCDEEPGFSDGVNFQGNVVQALKAYHEGQLGSQPIALTDIDRIIAIGSDRMMKAVAEARSGVLKECFKKDHQALGSINSPMQCMMKEICAQCIQRHVDPVTGAENFVFSCAGQDQNLDEVDFKHLRDRLDQNAVWEKVTKHFIT